MSLVLNNTPMEGVNVNGQKMERLFINGALVFEDVVKSIINGVPRIYLRDYINSNFPGKKKIEITIRGINGPLETQDLTGLDVTIINEGEIQGITWYSGDSMPAIKATSPITLINNGWLKASGGWGGKGAKGPNDTTVISIYKDLYIWKDYDRHHAGNYWAAYYVEINQTVYTINGVNVVYQGKHTAFETINGRTVRMDSNRRVKTEKYKYTSEFYYLIEKVDTTVTRIGGEGGEKGAGQGYARAAQPGKVGSPSSPAGGYSGGKGGTGGSWGKSGAKGADVVSNKGSEGNPPGYVIEGISNIRSSSKLGSTIGISK